MSGFVAASGLRVPRKHLGWCAEAAGAGGWAETLRLIRLHFGGAA
ncbi:MAG: hypothetical protein Q4G36_10530 [Paracoccus sp. (in: a-proteobacteria)]|nr:hypothetical protein [Paracoccus sp. (in: a-proteobacteria)]